MPAVMPGYQPPVGLMDSLSSGLMNSTPGYWSQLAYHMAGSPVQGSYPTVPVPAGSAPSAPSGVGGGIGGTLLGVLGGLAKNPSLMNSIGKGIGGLLGSTPTAAGAIGPPAEGAIGGSVGGTPAAMGPPEMSAPAAPTEAATGVGGGAGSVSGGLLGGGTSIAGGAGTTSGVLGAGSPGVFASGSAGAGSAGPASSLGGAGALAAVPFATAALVGLMGAGLFDSKAQQQGNDLVNQWMKATGAKWVTNPALIAKPGTGIFGSSNAIVPAGGNTSMGTMYDKNGKALTDAQVHQMLVQYAQQNGLPTGDFHV